MFWRDPAGFMLKVGFHGEKNGKQAWITFLLFEKVDFMNHGFGGGFDPGDFDRLAVEHLRNLRGDFVFPVITFIDRFIQALPLRFTFEPADPDI